RCAMPGPPRGRIGLMSADLPHFPVTAMVLAAGEGRRFAARSNRFQLLAPGPDGLALVRVVRETALQTAVDVVVVGHHHYEAVGKALSGLALQHVRCAAAPLGMGASIKCGLARVPASHAVMVLLADMPFVRAETIVRVRQALQQGAD